MDIEVRENRSSQQYILLVGDIVEELESGNFFIVVEEYIAGKDKYILRHLINHSGLNGYYDDLIGLTDGVKLELGYKGYKTYSQLCYKLELVNK